MRALHQPTGSRSAPGQPHLPIGFSAACDILGPNLVAASPGLSEAGPSLDSVIASNPFGVGASGERRALRSGRCACCALAYEYEWWPGSPAHPYCGACIQHARNSDVSDDARTLARLRDHEPRIRAYADHAAQRATEYEGQAKQAKTDGARQAARALSQRDLYRRLLSDVYNLHSEAKGQCKTCKARYPCATVKVLEGGPGGAGDAIIRAASERASVVDPGWD